MKKKYLMFAQVFIAWSLCNQAPADVNRPDEGAGPTEVRMTIFVADLHDVDTANQNFTADVVMRAIWHDKRLAHNDATGKVVHPLADIWHPRLQWANQERVSKTFPETVEVSSAGKVTYLQRLWGKFTQPLRLRDFPFDEQEFNITLLAAEHSPDEVRLVQDSEVPSGLADNLSVAEWKVIASDTMTGVYEPLRKIKPLATFTIRFDAKRDAGYFVLSVIIPLVLIVAMSWVVFWIDPKESGTQIGVAMTSMLTLIAYRFAVDRSLPHIAYLTSMDIFLLGVMVLVFASLVEVIITSYLARSGRLQLARQTDWVMRPVLPLALAGVFALAFLLD